MCIDGVVVVPVSLSKVAVLVALILGKSLIEFVVEYRGKIVVVVVILGGKKQVVGRLVGAIVYINVVAVSLADELEFPLGTGVGIVNRNVVVVGSNVAVVESVIAAVDVLDIRTTEAQERLVE